VGGEIGNRSDPNASQPSESVRAFYDSIASDYDFEHDPWTNHYNNSTQDFLRSVLSPLKPKRILDIGIGSGNKIRLYASLGAEVCGIDVSRNMIRVSAYKSVNAGINPHLLSADAQALPFAKGTFDFVSCCGSVVNYCPEPKLALHEMARVLLPGGTLVVGFDNNTSLDSLWMLIDALTGHRLRYRARIEEAVAQFSQPGPFVTYPYFTSNGHLRYVPERFLNARWVTRVLARNGMAVNRTHGIHILSSLIPFTTLSDPKAKPWVRRLSSKLGSYDTKLVRLPNTANLGYHILMEVRKG